MSRRFTQADVLKMQDAGILRPSERLELVAGDIVEVTPQSPDHANFTMLLGDALRPLYAQLQYQLRFHSPLNCGQYDLPEPDIAVIRGKAFVAEGRHPRSSEAILVVEVAKNSVAEDRLKVSRYIAAGVGTYWLVNLAARQVEVYVHADAVGGAKLLEVPGTGTTWLVEFLWDLAAGK